MLEWLLDPVEPSRMHAVSIAVAWHGRLMVLAWGFLLPIGILIARFWKVTPQQKWPLETDSKIWWHTHLVLQIGGAIAACIAVGLVVVNGIYPRGLHALFGWSTMALVLVQVLGGVLRGSKGGPTALAADGSLRGDHYDMTRRRRIFEYIHKVAGYGAVAIAAVAVATGLWLANAPRWMGLGLAIWWASLLALGIFWQRQGRAFDTYQSIWGPDLRHPGNALPPSGWGMQRRGPHQPNRRDSP